MFCLVAFLIIGSLIGTIFYFAKKLQNSKNKNKRKSLSFVKALLIGFGSVAAIIILFFIAPTMIKDAKWVDKQESCAKQVGYESLNAYETSRTTVDVQSAYRDCIFL